MQRSTSTVRTVRCSSKLTRTPRRRAPSQGDGDGGDIDDGDDGDYGGDGFRSSGIKEGVNKYIFG